MNLSTNNIEELKNNIARLEDEINVINELNEIYLKHAENLGFDIDAILYKINNVNISTNNDSDEQIRNLKFELLEKTNIYNNLIFYHVIITTLFITMLVTFVITGVLENDMVASVLLIGMLATGSAVISDSSKKLDNAKIETYSKIADIKREKYSRKLLELQNEQKACYKYINDNLKLRNEDYTQLDYQYTILMRITKNQLNNDEIKTNSKGNKTKVKAKIL